MAATVMWPTSSQASAGDGAAASAKARATRVDCMRMAAASAPPGQWQIRIMRQPGYPLLGRDASQRRAHGGFAYRQVAQCGERGERDVGVPHPVVIPGAGDGNSAEVGTEEGADLVRQQREAEQRAEVAGAEQFADDTRGRR